ncbi:asparagine synthase (glutamine-hydrolyzing) [Thalassospiraceae bacterium LMO-JJ14]|nr:asparagine synthase (glutamine-hydrolyzing) [Thalassospiraceae bacterium LMO-JJ14]
MCGIAGCIDLSQSTSAEDLRRIVASMTETLAHRGPDDTGIWIDAAAGLALGHRRLSIIDLSSAGHQPMVSPEGGHALVCNAEIYNYRDLRRDLENQGATFRGHSDTEVLLQACARWGVKKALEKASGMFAFAFWDRRTRILSLARDHAGMKPLYWGRFGDWLIFASELKALHRHPAFTAEIDRDALAGLIAYNYVPGTHSIYSNVHKMRQGHIVEISCHGNVHEEAFWRQEEIVTEGQRHPKMDAVSSMDELDNVLQEAVARHMVSDVPVASLLSGGIDSSLITALMQRISGTPVQSFAVRFLDPEFNEADHARAIASHIGTRHTELTVGADDALQVIDRLPEIYDEPFADLSQIPTTIISTLVAQHAKVVLTGDGGDELFGGYPRYRITLEHQRTISQLPTFMRNAIAWMVQKGAHSSLRSLTRFCPPIAGQKLTPERLLKAAALLKEDRFIEAYRRTLVHWDPVEAVVPGGREPLGPLHRDWSGRRLGQPLADMRSIDSATYLPDDILVKVDRASMAAGLEARIPFLDPDVIKFAWQLSPELCFRKGNLKWILQQVLHRHVPQQLTDRPKMGFGVPMHTWLRGPLRDWAEDLLDPRRMKEDGFLNPAPIRKRWEQHLAGDQNWQYSLWPVLIFQQWLRAGGNNSSHG